MKRFDSTAPALPTAETRTPAREPSIAGDVGVPLLQAAVTAFLLSTLLTVALASLTPHWPAISGIIFLVIFAAAWAWLLIDHRRLLWGIETLTQRDLDGDHLVGNPAEQRLVVEVHDGRTQHIIRADLLDITDDRLIAFALAVDKGRPMVETAWAKDRTVFPQGINQYRALRAKLLELQLLTKTSDAPNATVTWTHAGRAVIRALVDHAHTHTHGANPLHTPTTQWGRGLRNILRRP